MTASDKMTLVLGGTGRTGSLLAQKLAKRAVAVRTAARQGTDVTFDWDEPSTHAPALQGVDRMYLVTPVGRIRFAPQVSGLLDLAERAGVRHVTYLSAYGSERMPPEIDIRAVELALSRRTAFTHSILRPAWVMQNFADAHLPLINDTITVPSGGGREAFVDADDIAAIALETLIDPDAHAGAIYAPTGPQALTFSEVARTISDVIGRPIIYNDIDQNVWIDGAIVAGFVPAEYGVMLRWLTGSVIAGNSARPNDDIERVTGRPARRFEDFVRRNAAAWAPASPKVPIAT
jgi:uncharacterized protein YbjT (DUF2867 family)